MKFGIFIFAEGEFLGLLLCQLLFNQFEDNFLHSITHIRTDAQLTGANLPYVRLITT